MPELQRVFLWDADIDIEVDWDVDVEVCNSSAELEAGVRRKILCPKAIAIYEAYIQDFLSLLVPLY